MKLARTPVNLTSLIQCCEINYWRLMALLPVREAGACRCFAVPGPGVVLQCRFEIEDVSRYTTGLRITQAAQASVWLPGFTLQVRVYHDAEVAEVVACQGIRHIRPAYDYPNPAMHQPDEKHGWNAFLGEWLAWCLRHGQEWAAHRESLDA